jgi:hypothetical protein
MTCTTWQPVFDTSWTGEAEIAAWELAGGCASYRAAWLLNLLAFSLGLIIAPVRTWRALQRGRSSANLYTGPWNDEWLDASLGQLRTRMTADPGARPLRGIDVMLFVIYALPGLLGMFALAFGVGAVVHWLAAR